jgi:hypothetical protein
MPLPSCAETESAADSPTAVAASLPVESAIAVPLSASSRCQTAAKLDLNTPGGFGAGAFDGSPYST